MTHATELNRLRPDNRVIAEKNEMAVLQVVRWYGHARRSDIARAVWPRSTPRVAAKMAQLTVARLLASQQLEQSDYAGAYSLVLAPRGVTRLTSHGFKTRRGYELSSVAGPRFSHRALTTRYLIERSTLGHTAVSEHALERGWGPVKRQELTRRYGKAPAGLVLVSGAERGYDPSILAADWVVMKPEYWTDTSMKHVLAVCPHLGTSLVPGIVLDRLVLAHGFRQWQNKLAIPKRVGRYLSRHPELSAVLPKIVLVRCYVDPPLVWRGYEEIPWST